MTEESNYKIKKKLRTLGENETYSYEGILEADTIKQVVMKENNKKEYLRRTKKKNTRDQTICRNLVKRINVYAASLIKYSRPFLK